MNFESLRLFGSITMRSGNRMQFSTADVNNDELVSQKEFNDILHMYNVDSISFGSLDLNGDNQIDETEWSKMEVKMDFQNEINAYDSRISQDFIGKDVVLRPAVAEALANFITTYVATQGDAILNSDAVESFKTALNAEYQRICAEFNPRRPTVILETAIQESIASVVTPDTMSDWHETTLTNDIRQEATSWLNANYNSFSVEPGEAPEAAAQKAAAALKTHIQEWLQEEISDANGNTKTRIQDYEEQALEHEYERADDAVTTLTNLKTDLARDIQTAKTNVANLVSRIQSSNIPNLMQNAEISSILRDLNNAENTLDSIGSLDSIDGLLTEQLGIATAARDGIRNKIDNRNVVEFNSQLAEDAANIAVNALSKVQDSTLVSSVNSAINTINDCSTRFTNFLNNYYASLDDYGKAELALSEYNGSQNATGKFNLAQKINTLLSNMSVTLKSAGVSTNIVDSAVQETRNFYENIIAGIDSLKSTTLEAVGIMLIGQSASDNGDAMRGDNNKYSINKAIVAQKVLGFILDAINQQGDNVDDTNGTGRGGRTGGTTTQTISNRTKIDNALSEYTGVETSYGSDAKTVANDTKNKVNNLLDSIKGSLVSQFSEASTICTQLKNRYAATITSLSTSLAALNGTVSKDGISFVNTGYTKAMLINKEAIARIFKHELLAILPADEEQSAGASYFDENVDTSELGMENITQMPYLTLLQTGKMQLNARLAQMYQALNVGGHGYLKYATCAQNAYYNALTHYNDVFNVTYSSATNSQYKLSVDQDGVNYNLLYTHGQVMQESLTIDYSKVAEYLKDEFLKELDNYSDGRSGSSTSGGRGGTTGTTGSGTTGRGDGTTGNGTNGRGTTNRGGSTTR